MTFPTVAVVTTNLDSSGDSPASARSDLLDAVQKLNQMIAHVSTFAATLLDDADAATARTTIGLGTGNFPSFAGLTVTGGYPFSVDTSVGETYLKGYSGGWAMAYSFKGNSGTSKGGFGALGNNDTLSNFWIGPSYSSPWMMISQNVIGVRSSGTLSTTGTAWLNFVDTVERGWIGYGGGDGSFGISNSVGLIKLLSATQVTGSITATGTVSGATATGAGTSSAVVGVASSSGFGVYGSSSSGAGVQGISNSSYGVQGISSSGGIGIYGESNNNYGVQGFSGTGTGVLGQTTSGLALWGSSGSGPALKLQPSSQPTTSVSDGSFYCSSTGQPYVRISGAWKSINVT